MFVFLPVRQAKALGVNKVSLTPLPIECLDINSREARRRKKRIEKRNAKKERRKENDRC